WSDGDGLGLHAVTIKLMTPTTANQNLCFLILSPPTMQINLWYVLANTKNRALQSQPQLIRLESHWAQASVERSRRSRPAIKHPRGQKPESLLHALLPPSDERNGAQPDRQTQYRHPPRHKKPPVPLPASATQIVHAVRQRQVLLPLDPQAAEYLDGELGNT